MKDNHWTQHEDETLLAMRQAGATREEIAAATGRSVESVGKRLGRLRKGGADLPRLGRAWTTEEQRKAVALARAGYNVARVAQAIGRAHSSVMCLFRRLGIDTSDGREKSRVVGMIVDTGVPSDELLADRDRRHSAPRSVTAWLMGDPEPGRSALDRRLGA